MLILHPSSRCDVCLDAYTWQTIAQTPHAIPCGHVFCRPCLFALSPYLCPLCRKKFEPNKAKKLHVDRPENVDDNRENDLLQRLAISWEAPEDQLRPLLFEVDTWLDTRADESCVGLRKARAALTRHIELKKVEMTLGDALNDIHARFEEMTIAYHADRGQAIATETKLKADNSALIRENEDLKAKVKELSTPPSEQYGLLKKPLPPPPVPISTKYIPTVAQAMAQDRVRFDFPPSDSPYTLSFELDKRHKGKAKSASYQLISPPNSQNPQPLPTQPPKMDPSEGSSHSCHQSSRERRISTPAPPSGLKLQFEPTNQPLDGFELAHTYLRGFSQGVSDGQMLAAPRSSRSQQSRASTGHSRSAVPLLDNDESSEIRSIQSSRSTQSREIQTSARPPHHRRQNTVSPIGQRGQDRSRNQATHPSLVALLSSPPSMASLPTSPPIHGPNPSLSQPSHGHQLPEILIQPNPARPESPAPSQVSSWGTIISSSTNHTTYSLLGLRDFRAGSYPRGGLEGASIATSPRLPGRNGTRIIPERLSQYPPPTPSLNSWHGSTASLSPAQTQDEPSSPNGYYSGDETEIELLNPNYIRGSMNGHLRPMEPQRMTRGRNQPLPAVSPSASFLFGEPIIAEEDSRSNTNTMEAFGNALGLELTTGPTPISAPTPVVPHQSFLRSFSDGA